MATPYTNGIRDNGDAPHATSGAVWRSAREQGYLKQLPSGNWARLRPVALDRLLISGEVADLLTPLVVKMVMDGADTVSLDTFLNNATAERTLGTVAETIQLLDLVCRAAFVEPRIVDNPQADDEISLADLSLEDKGLAFSLAMQPAEELRRFRLEPTPDVATVPDRDQNEHTA